MDPFFNPAPVDPDDKMFHPWQTELCSDARAQVMLPSGLPAEITIHLHCWAATLDQARITGQVITEWMLEGRPALGC